MKELLNIASYYLKGKPVYPAARRLLNLLFIICISSFIYEKIYGHYTWLDFTDYKGILNFLIKGRFFIPLSILIVVYASTQFFSFVCFAAINHIKSVKIQREILAYQFNKEAIDEVLEGIENATKQVVPVTFTPELIVNIYTELRAKIKPEIFEKLEENLRDPRNNLEANFILLVRAIIAITIFKMTIPEFGWLLYILTLVSLLFGIIIVSIAYRMLDILPTLINKMHAHAEEYLKVYNQQLQESK